MSESKRKSDVVREAVARGDYKKALGIARNFRLGISKEDSDAMKRGFECMVYPDFYRSIGKDIQLEIQNGVNTLLRLYG